jgi:hypothetical protein
MATVELLPLDDYEAGSFPFGPVELDSSITQIVLQVARCTSATPDIWPDEAPEISLAHEYSLDGGANWNGYGGATAPGGIFVSGRTHQEAPFTAITGGDIPPEVNEVPRLYRGVLGITGGTLHSYVQADVT